MAESIRNEARHSEVQEHSYTYEGQPVTVIDTFSRHGKRIAVILDREGDRFEVFMDQLS